MDIALRDVSRGGHVWKADSSYAPLRLVHPRMVEIQEQQQATETRYAPVGLRSSA